MMHPSRPRLDARLTTRPTSGAPPSTPGLKALTLWQPWAALVAIGAKRVETRAWPCPPSSLGAWIAIHVAQGGLSASQLHRTMTCEPFRSALAACDITAATETQATLPRGALVALVHLVGCEPTERVRFRLSARERAFGDYRPGRFAWQFDEIIRLPRPIRARGAHRLWRLPATVVARVLADLRAHPDVLLHAIEGDRG